MKAVVRTQSARTERDESPYACECRSLAVACAMGGLRVDKKCPPAFAQAFKSFRGKKGHLEYFDRKWLSLRLNAVKRGMILDQTVTPDFLKLITPSRCPVTLEPFETDGKSDRNPSVDRLVNEGTYAAGNLGILSVRANRAKGEKSFEEVVQLACAEEDVGHLSAVEWARLVSLMYGAWSVSVRRQDCYLVPLATLPGRHMFTTTSQVVQQLLLSEANSSTRTDRYFAWQAVCSKATYPIEMFDQLLSALKAAVQVEDYAPNAWLVPGVFDRFTHWYDACRDGIEMLLEGLLKGRGVTFDSGPIVERWKVGARHLA